MNFGVLCFLGDLCGRGHLQSLVLPERHADELQQLARLFVGLRRGDDRDVHAARLVDLHVVDLGEQQLVAQAERVVAAAVEALAATRR